MRVLEITIGILAMVTVSTLVGVLLVGGFLFKTCLEIMDS